MRTLAAFVAALGMLVGGLLLLVIVAEGGWLTVWAVLLLVPGCWAAKEGWYER